MTRIRSIAAGELPAFTTLTGPEHAADQAAYVSNMIDRGAMRPDWCFVAEDAGRLSGRYAYWSMPSIEHPEAIVLFDLVAGNPGPGPAEAVGDALAADLVAHALAGAREAGSKTLGYMLDDPTQWPQWQDDHDRRAAWLESAGFRVRRATARYELDPADAGAASLVDRLPPNQDSSPPPSERLRFRSIEDVGEPAFLDAIERVSVGSLDQVTRDERERLGPEAEAQQTLDELRSMIYEPPWWELAFDSDDQLVGLIMPAGTPTFVSIGYIGVVAEQRGRGYVHDLLARGTATLLRIGNGQVIRADTDVDNVPMALAFERAGYRGFATRREYEIRL